MALFDFRGRQIGDNIDPSKLAKELSKQMLGKTTEVKNFKGGGNVNKKIISELTRKLTKIFGESEMASDLEEAKKYTKDLLTQFKKSENKNIKRDKSISNTEKNIEKLWKASQSKHSLHVSVNGLEPEAERQFAKAIADAAKSGGARASFGGRGASGGGGNFGYHKLFEQHSKIMLKQIKEQTMFTARFNAIVGGLKLGAGVFGGVFGGGVALDLNSMVSRFSEVIKSEEEFRLGMKDIIFSTTEISAQTDKLQDSYLKIDDIVNRTGHSRQVALKIQTQEMSKGFSVTRKTLLTEKERVEQIKDFQSSMASSLSMSKQLGINAEESADYIGRMRREMGWSAVQSTQLVRDMKAISESSGLFGSHLLDALKKSDAVMRSLRNSGNLTNRNLKNVTTVMASASKFGVDDVAEPLLRATSSLKEWINATPETKTALAQIFGTDPKEIQKVIMGGYGKGKEGYKSMGENLDKRATDLIQQTFSAGARELAAAGASFNEATGVLKTKGGKEIKVTLENFDALMQAVPELSQVANQNIYSALKMEAGQAMNLSKAIKESTMSTDEKIKSIEKEILENKKLGVSTEDLNQRIKDLKINDFLSNVTDLSEGMKAGNFEESLKKAFGDNAAFQKAMQEGFEPFIKKAQDTIGDSGLKSIADPKKLREMLMSGNQEQINLASKKLGEIAEGIAKQEKVQSDPMYRIEDILKRFEQWSGQSIAPELAKPALKYAAWGIQFGFMAGSLAVLVRNTAVMLNLMRGKMPTSTLGAVGLDPKSSKYLMNTEKFLRQLWVASQSSHSIHVSLNEFSSRSINQLRTMRGGFSGRSGASGGMTVRERAAERRRGVKTTGRGVTGRGGGGIGSALSDLALNWGPEILTGYMFSNMMPTGEEGGSFLGDIAKQAGGMAAGMGVAMLARKFLGKGLMGQMAGGILGDTAMASLSPEGGGITDTILGGLYDIWSLKDLIGDKASKGGGLLKSALGKGGGLLGKGGSLLGKGAGLLGKAAGPLALLTGAASGALGAGKEGMSLFEGSLLGALTGGAGRGSSLSNSLGITKGSNADELLGAYGSMAYGATTGATLGGPVGAAAGAAIAGGAEVYKVARDAGKVVENLQKELSATSARQNKFNESSLGVISNISDSEEKLKELKNTLESARNKLAGSKTQLGIEAANLSDNSGLMSYIPGMGAGYKAAKSSYDATLADLKNQETFVAQLEQQTKTLEDSLVNANKSKEAVEQAKKDVTPANLGAFDKSASKDALAESIKTSLDEKTIGGTESPVSKVISVLTEIKDLVSAFKPKEISESLVNIVTQINNEKNSRIANMQNLGLFEKNISNEALNPSYSTASNLVQAMTTTMEGGNKNILERIFSKTPLQESFKAVAHYANNALSVSESALIEHANVANNLNKLTEGNLTGTLGDVTTKNLPGVDLEETIQKEREAMKAGPAGVMAGMETLNDYFLNIQKGLLTEIKDHLAAIEDSMKYTGSKQVGNSTFSKKVDLSNLPMVAHSPDFAEYGYSQAEGGVSKNPSVGVM